MRRLLASLLLASCAGSAPRAPLGHATEAPLSAAAAPAPAEPVQTSVPAVSAPPGSLPAAATSAAVPLTFEQAAPDGRWLVTCQARNDTDDSGAIDVQVGVHGELGGDRLARYLTFETGSELEIDSLLAASADGRWLVLERGGRSELLDTVSSQSVDLTALGADTLRFDGPRGPHRTLAFDGDRLFYVRGSSSWELVERRLSSGSERSLARGSEPLLRFSLDAAGALLLLEVSSAEAGHRPRFDWPYPVTSGMERCRGPTAHYLAPRSVRPPSYLVLDRDSAELVRVDDLAAIYGRTLLRRDADGALFAVVKAGRRTLTDRDCAGRILWLDSARDQLMIGCNLLKKPGRLGVELLSRGRRTPLEIDVAALGFDEPARPSERLTALYPGADVVLYDADKRLLHRLRSGDAVLATRAARAVVRRERSLLLFDADTGAATPFGGGTLDPLGTVLTQGSLVLASPFLVDLETGKLRGTLPGRPLALSNTGNALLPAVPATSAALAMGPLTWHSPE